MLAQPRRFLPPASRPALQVHTAYNEPQCPSLGASALTVPCSGTPPSQSQRKLLSSKKAFLDHFLPWCLALCGAALGNAVIHTSLQVDLPTSCRSILEVSGPGMLRTLCMLYYREQAVPVRCCISFHPVSCWEKPGHLQSWLAMSSLSPLPNSNTHIWRS